MGINLGSAYGEILIGTGGAEQSVQSLSDRLRSVGTTMSLAISAPLIAVGTAALVSASGFEQSMTVVTEECGEELPVSRMIVDDENGSHAPACPPCLRPTVGALRRAVGQRSRVASSIHCSISLSRASGSIGRAMNVAAPSARARASSSRDITVAE